MSGSLTLTLWTYIYYGQIYIMDKNIVDNKYIKDQNGVDKMSYNLQ